MQLFEQSRALETALNKHKANEKIGFVPTMGNLHQGHLSLVEKSLQDNDFTVLSIYVNRRQFNQKSDFDAYPKTLEQDLDLLPGSDRLMVFAPQSEHEIFPPHFESISLELGLVGNSFEAKSRPGHFQGVIDVLHQFFTLINPTCAYFGLKDFQQVAVVKCLCAAYFKEIQIREAETVREENGLAMSSRNARLSPEDRLKAAEVYNSLQRVSRNFKIMGKKVLDQERTHLSNLGFSVDYLETIDAQSFLPLHEFNDKNDLRVLVALWLNGVRLIDNLAIKS